MSTTNFRELVAKNAHSVMICATCLSEVAEGDLPQPGWVGSRYEPCEGILFVMQNPGAAPKNYKEERDSCMQTELLLFKNSNTLAAYERLAQVFLEDATGRNKWKQPWKKWSHPVSKIVSDPQEMAWLNVVKVRTKGNAALSLSQVRHGISHHLTVEIESLNPALVVTIGKDAQISVAEISGKLKNSFVTASLHGMSPSNADADKVKSTWQNLRNGQKP